MKGEWGKVWLHRVTLSDFTLLLCRYLMQRNWINIFFYQAYLCKNLISPAWSGFKDNLIGPQLVPGSPLPPSRSRPASLVVGASSERQIEDGEEVKLASCHGGWHHAQI